MPLLEIIAHRNFQYVYILMMGLIYDSAIIPINSQIIVLTIILISWLLQGLYKLNDFKINMSDFDMGYLIRDKLESLYYVVDSVIFSLSNADSCQFLNGD